MKLYVLLVCHCRATGPATPSTGGPSSTGPATGWWWPAGSSTASSSEQSRHAAHLWVRLRRKGVKMFLELCYSFFYFFY